MSYTLKSKDIKFLNAVDYIIAQHKRLGLKPNTENAISKLVFAKRSVIAKIRASQRGVSQSQIEKLALYYNLNFNYFYRSTVLLEYEPNSAERNEQQSEQGSEGRNNHLSFKGDNYGVVDNGQINVYLEKIRQIGESSIEPLPKSYHALLQNIRLEFQGLNQKLVEKANKLKKVEELLKEQILNLQQELNEARRSENQTLKKYLDSASQKNGVLQTTKNWA